MSWNQQVGKKFNKQQIMNYIFSKDVVSRSEIIEETGLKKATVANLVTELLEEQLVLEDGKDQSTGGRRSQLLRFHQNAGFALGIDIGVNYLHGVVVNLKGEIIFEQLQPIYTIQRENYLQNVLALIDTLQKNVPISPYAVIGLGVAVPGSIYQDGTIMNAPNLHWENFDFHHFLQQHIDYPFYISNEANAGAYAGYVVEHHKEIPNLLYVSIGVGLGVGIVIDHTIYLGAQGFSGESGHMIIQMNGRLCKCGRKGCWEAYASEYALIREATYLLKEHDLSLERLINLAENGHADVLQLFADIGYHIGLGMTNLIHTFNPEKIIIGNRMTLAQKFIAPSIEEAIRSNTMPFHLDALSIDYSSLKEHSIVLGAAAFIIDRFIQLPFE